MKIKTLASIVLMGTLAMGSTGRTSNKNYSQYKFDGKIDKDYIVFGEIKYRIGDDNNFLRITKPNGEVKLYMDTKKDDLKIEYVITSNNNRISQKTKKLSLIKEQKEFDIYLRKILDKKSEYSKSKN